MSFDRSSWFLYHLRGENIEVVVKKMCLGQRSLSWITIDVVVYLSARGGEVTAGVVHSQYPGLPVGEFRQFEVGVALAEAGAAAEDALAGEARAYGEDPWPTPELPLLPATRTILLHNYQQDKQITMVNMFFVSRVSM